MDSISCSLFDFPHLSLSIVNKIVSRWSKMKRHPQRRWTVWMKIFAFFEHSWFFPHIFTAPSRDEPITSFSFFILLFFWSKLSTLGPKISLFQDRISLSCWPIFRLLKAVGWDRCLPFAIWIIPQTCRWRVPFAFILLHMKFRRHFGCEIDFSWILVLRCKHRQLKKLTSLFSTLTRL